jgi:hypothetical protein
MATNFILYYSIWSLFATHLQQDLKLTAMGTAVPFMLANILSFLGVRATASAFCYHQGAIFGGLVAPILAFFAVNFNGGYALPMLIGTVVAGASVVVSLLLSSETKGTVLVAELQVA